MNKILLERKFILEYIEDVINTFKLHSFYINNNKYHHNTSYKNATSIIKNGLLSLDDLNKLGIVSYSEEMLKILSDIESHVNGNDAISLSIVGLKDLQSYEFEYSPYMETQIDFLISRRIITSRSSVHYGNEYLSYNSIYPDKFRAIDIRLLKYLNFVKTNDRYACFGMSIEGLVENYNYLKDIAIALNSMALDIPLREMSNNDGLLLDIEGLSKIPKLLLKR